MTLPATLKKIVDVLDSAAIPYMVVGSVASGLHGYERSTRDIDIVISASAEQIQVLLSSFPAPDYYADMHGALDALRSHSMFNVLDLNEGWKIDFIFVKPGSFDALQFRRRIQAELGGMKVFVGTAEDTVIAKLRWAKMGQSARQIQDVAGVLRVRRGKLDSDYVLKWVHELDLQAEWEAAKALAEAL
jgi:hypothetical protein